MSRPVPSRQALRHLARLCRGDSIPATTRPTLCGSIRHLQPHPQPAPRRDRDFSTSLALLQAPSSTTDQSSTTPDAPPLPDTTSYYTLFPSTLSRGPPPRGPFAIPLPQLRREFLQLQSFYHPDKFPSPPSSTTPSANNLIALSSLINTAYRTLSDPLLRAQYLLLHDHGVDVTSEDNSANTTDSATLMEVMEAQESVESAETQADVDALSSENKARIEETETKMGKAFEHGDADTARRECVRLKYWRSLQQGLDDWEPGKEVRLVH